MPLLLRLLTNANTGKVFAAIRGTELATSGATPTLERGLATGSRALAVTTVTPLVSPGALAQPSSRSLSMSRKIPGTVIGVATEVATGEGSLSIAGATPTFNISVTTIVTPDAPATLSFSAGHEPILTFSKDIELVASGDDSHIATGGDFPGWTNAGHETFFGHDQSGNDFRAFLRYILNLPQGSNIQSAKVRFEASELVGDIPTLRLQAEDVDNATRVASEADFLAREDTLTTAFVDWTPASWVVDSLHDSPNLAPLVQEVINRAGWASGNAFHLYVGVPAVGGGVDKLLGTYSYDGVQNNLGTTPPVLTVTWIIGSIGLTPPTIALEIAEQTPIIGNAITLSPSFGRLSFFEEIPVIDTALAPTAAALTIDEQTPTVDVPASTLPSGIIHDWQFDDATTLFDEVGTLDLPVSGATLTSLGLDYDGIDDTTELTDSDVFAGALNVDQDYTIAMLVILEANPNQELANLFAHRRSNHDRVLIQERDGIINCGVDTESSGGSSIDQVATDGTGIFGNLVLLTMRYTGAGTQQITFWKNKAAVTETTPNIFEASGNGIGIGCSRGNNNNALCEIGRATIWNRVLTDNEITNEVWPVMVSYASGRGHTLSE